MHAMTEHEAKAHVGALYGQAAQRWQERVTGAEFMRRFSEGTLPIEVFSLFFRDWGKYTIEINTVIACAYQKYLHFFKQHPDLMAAMGEKIADEFMHPAPPGHVLIMFQTAEALGISGEEILTQPLAAHARAKIDFTRSILYEGTAAEWFALSCGEEMMGHWAGECHRILTSKYGFSSDQTVYFSKHHEADLEVHDGSVMGHGQFNRACLERLLQTGESWERATYGMEYCALTFLDIHGLWLSGTLEAARREHLI